MASPIFVSSPTPEPAPVLSPTTAALLKDNPQNTSVSSLSNLTRSRSRAKSTTGTPPTQRQPSTPTIKEAPEMGSAYSATTYSVDYAEIANSELLPGNNRFGAQRFKLRLRGKDTYGKEFSQQHLKEKFPDIDFEMFLKNETTQLLFNAIDNVASVFGVCTTDDHLLFVREYLPNGSLDDIINKKGTEYPKFSFWRKIRIVSSIAKAMAFVLSKPQCFTNPNLSKTNILFTHLWEAKLADQDYLPFKKCLVEVKPIDERSLMKEFGILMYEIITETNGDSIREYGLPSFLDGWPKSLVSLAEECISLENIWNFSSLSNSTIFDTIIIEAASRACDIYNCTWDELRKSGPKGSIVKVTWHTFISNLSDKLGIDYSPDLENTIECQCLRYMLGCKTSTSDVITNEAFERLVKCIGPMVDLRDTLDQVKELLAEPWFMGALTPNEAEKMLLSVPGQRSFMVRFSANSGEFSITWRVKDKVMHTRVPAVERYNLHNYVEVELKRKKFEESPPSPYKTLFERQLPKLHNYKFIV